jgi:hypothetical protein
MKVPDGPRHVTLSKEIYHMCSPGEIHFKAYLHAFQNKLKDSC